MWSQIDENMIVRYTPAKTQFTSGATVTLDLNMMPMVVEELAKVPVEARRGPDRQSAHRLALSAGLPAFSDAGGPHVAIPHFLADAGDHADLAPYLAEIPVAAPTDDLAKQAGHANKRTTAKVYDRAQLEAARRVAKARTAHRGNTE